MTRARVAIVALGIGVGVGGKFLGGYAGAVVIGAGIGLAVLGLGRRRPHLLRRRTDDGDPDPGERWSEW